MDLLRIGLSRVGLDLLDLFGDLRSCWISRERWLMRHDGVKGKVVVPKVLSTPFSSASQQRRG